MWLIIMEGNLSNTTLSEFADKLNEIMPVISRSFFKMLFNDVLKGKITAPQLFILCFLSRQKEAKMTDIANFLEVSTAAATGIINRLVKLGYVQRVYDEADRRIIRIKLNAKGEEFVNKINSQKKQRIVDIFGKISDKERDEYLRILMRIYEIIEKEKNE